MFERGPDEEGIETNSNRAILFRVAFERGPDEEGIETWTRSRFPQPVFERGPDEEGIETQRLRCQHQSLRTFERGPDEEGIETILNVIFVFVSV